MKKYFITAAIDYASGKGHIGNYYEKVLVDVISRYKKKQGYDVLLQTGLDEHGQKVEDKAKEANKAPQDFVDDLSEVTKSLLSELNVDYDIFARTTDSNHKRVVADIYQKLYDQGDIYKSVYEGLYCKPCESFFIESQLVGGKCPDCGREVEKQAEEAYFLKLSNYEERLKKHYADNVSFAVPTEKKNDIYKGYIEDGLRDLCVSRVSLNWGVELPFDKEHVSYVWIDALTNYITFLGYEVNEESNEKYKKYWPADLQVIGKDISRFHLIYWPVILMALGEPLPKQIFIHSWVSFNNGKMSKSKGNILYSDELIKKYGTDAIRFSLINEMPLLNDGNITESIIVERINSELANTYGNLVNRTISMTNKYFDGVISSDNKRTDIDLNLRNEVLDLYNIVDENMEKHKYSQVLKEIFGVLRKCNKYVDETTPWILGKDEAEKERLNTVLYTLLESIRICTVLLEPFIPETAEKVFVQLNTKEKSFDSIKEFNGMELGKKIGAASPIFLRIDKNK